MPTISLFGIGSTDYSNYVNKRKFKVNDINEITKWVDANHVTHGEFVRTRISGSFSMSFLTATEYNSFVTVANAAKGTDGKYAITIFVVNRNATATVNAFLDFSVKTAFKNDAYGGTAAVFQVDVKLEEE